MKFKELLTVLDSNAYLNIVSEKGQWLYEGKVIFITSDLLERKVKLVDVKLAFICKLLLQRRINKWTYMKEWLWQHSLWLR